MIDGQSLHASVLRAMHRPTTLRQPGSIAPTMPAVAPEAAKQAQTAEKPQRGIEAFLACEPPRVTAHQKGAAVTKAGKVRFYTKTKLKNEAKRLQAILLPIRPSVPMEGPLEFAVAFIYPWLKSQSKERKLYSRYMIDTRPDCSNVVKLIEDVMTEMGFWNDDSQISMLVVFKYRGDEPGIAVRIAAEPHILRELS